MSQPNISLYDILGVPSTATQDEIRAAYRASAKQYHPDVNKAPNAGRLTEMLNAAYEVLSDPEKRREYDGHYAAGDAMDESGEPAREVWDLLTCDSCRNDHPQLRLANFYNVISIIIFSRMAGDGGVLCPDCRSIRAARTGLFSAAFGPWGFPWGIFYAIRAIYAAAIGGEQPSLLNAQLLRHQGIAYLQRNMRDESFTSLSESLEFEMNPSVLDMLKESFYDGARRMPKPGWMRGQKIALAGVLIPVVILFGLVSVMGSTPSSSRSSSVASTAQMTSDLAQPEASPTENPLRSLAQLCLNSKTDTSQKIYHTCEGVIPSMQSYLDKAKTQAEKDYLSVVIAEAQMSQAIAGWNLGLKDEARALHEKADITFKSISVTATEEKTQQRARVDYDCYALDHCPK
jgi:curved DNA-binding protein CbpA